ncbi:hypothetical protein BFU36_11360 [Sulfolobus sp. A20]|uniref:helix-turn-helix transcriptional regulator n=1 Tax=Sulfolobaceae TaxID=118883 RepID=UPI000845BF36|nr:MULTISPECIES: helix-turn-helix domain-containing protein [unclassified Sulfolobus]TRM75827.1 hypothetical protein DJ523_02265 [Sulfolobus sp. E5]TRM77422.1 hypothetical protein DJ532_04495 [Sulfolobus sp. A20-N-F8]TRM84089.1 hypothetical protein DJ531_02195 [Sulfolobus sp. A20-N-F6]TRM85296.1 hypothetical protein DJ522_01270 [Sulfolobus sp. F3]TRM86603.1 hypothetical protein DJ529_10865 [Sulfolobus sp. C3]TRM92772.1 hypothetical protein DJ526_05250 [Sulfolobus sp. A20-N-G8]TRN03999.1 hypo
MISLTLIIIDILVGIIVFFVSREVMLRSNKDKEVLTTSSSDNDDKVFNAIKSGAKTLNEIMKYTGLPKSTAYKSLKRLLKQGKVEKVINDKGNVRYVIKNEKDKNNSSS